MTTSISARLDWYRSTVTDAKTISLLTSTFFVDADVVSFNAMDGYRDVRQQIQTKGLYLSMPHHQSMGNGVLFSGEPLRALERISQNPSWVALVGMGLYDARPSRIDIAIDVLDCPLTGDAVRQRLVRQEAITRFKQWDVRQNEGAATGYTLYIGAKTSDKMVRIYDKGAEIGTGQNWWRFEMVFKDVRAREAWNIIRDIPTALALLPVARAMLASVLSFPKWQAWQALFGGDVEYQWAEIPRTQSDKMAWLMKQVAPTFIASYNERGDWSLLDEFTERIKGLVDWS